MTKKRLSAPPDREKEIPRLIELLLETEQRLESLTAGEIDSVSSRDGRIFLLRRAQEQLRLSEATKQTAILNALPARVALLDNRGVILAVNEAWRKFSGGNPAPKPDYGVGSNYLEICDQVRGLRATGARQAAAGIRSVLEGTVDDFTLEYPSELPAEERWFRMVVTPIAPGRSSGAVVMHSDISEYRRAIDALRESESRFRGTFEQAAVGIAHVSLDGVFLRVNDKLCSIVGYTRQELLRMSFFDLTLPEDRPEGEAARKALLAGDLTTYSAEKRYRCKSSDVVWVLVAVTLERTAGGEPKYFISVFDDITKRKQAEDGFRELSQKTERRERMLTTMLSSTTDFTYIFDREGRFVFANQPLLNLWGIDLEEAVGKNFYDLGYPSAMAETLQRQIREVFETNGNVTGETEYTSPTGRSGYFEYIFSPAFGPDGSVDFVVGSTRDVTERKERVEALRTSEKRFKTLFEQAAVGVAQRDAITGKYVQANLRYSEITGRSPEELQHLTAADISHPRDVNRERDLIGQLTAGVRREFAVEKRYLRKDGSEVWVNVTLSAMWAAGEPPDYIIAVAQDITARKQLEEQFRHAQKMDAIGTLAGGIAHDFNNILGAIIGYTELAHRAVKTETVVKGYLEAVLKASRRAAGLVRQILTFSRQQPTERRPTQLLPVVIESLELLRATIPSTIAFDLSLATDTPVVLADATQIHQLLMNLGTNAWHAMKDRPGRLQVTLETCNIGSVQKGGPITLPQGTYAHVSVRDTGIGMDEQTKRRIFEPFFTTKIIGEGTGLGLAVVHGIMNTHEGIVTVDTQPGQGTVFHLYFPAHIGDVAPVLAEDDPTPHGCGEQVLLVDDEELLAQVGEIALASLGYKGTAVTRAEEAMALIEADPRRFALVLVDLTMPEMTGMELAEAIWLIRPDLPIILMTGYSASLTAAEVEARGFQQLLIKPVTVHALGTAVKSVFSAVKNKGS